MNLPRTNSETIASLPVPDDFSLTHSKRLVNRIRSEIMSNGDSIDFKRYMELALYEPGLGYYSAEAKKFGVDGDFVTAPEISSLFSRCLARQCQQILGSINGELILELGAGTGTMASDVLQELERQNCLPKQYLILETSAELKQRQQQLLAEKGFNYLECVKWIDQIPKPFDGIILANEVLDALPVHRIAMQDRAVKELHVVWENNSFNWSAIPATDEINQYIRDIEVQLDLTLPNSYVTEIDPGFAAWLKTFSKVLQKGAMIFIDYGYSKKEYYHPQRMDGTLLCHYRHRAHAGPFLYPGLQDITTSVNFTSVAEAAIEANLDVKGYTTQAFFLMDCGLNEMMGMVDQDEQLLFLELARQVKLLALPGEMGERFKVIALTRGISDKLIGFSSADHRRYL